MNVYYAGMSLPMARVNGRATFARAHWPHPVIYARTSLSSYLSLMVTTIYVTTYFWDNIIFGPVTNARSVLWYFFRIYYLSASKWDRLNGID